MSEGAETMLAYICVFCLLGWIPIVAIGWVVIEIIESVKQWEVRNED